MIHLGTPGLSTPGRERRATIVRLLGAAWLALVPGAGSAAGQGQHDGRAKTVARRYFEDVWSGKATRLDDRVSRDYVMYGGDGAPRARGPREAQDVVGAYMKAFPDLEVTVDDVIAEGSRVVVRWTARGTHAGALRDIGPTGTRVTFRGMHQMTVEKGLIVAERYSYDSLDLYQQLGAIRR